MPVSARDPAQIGYGSHHPTLTNVTQRSRRPAAVPTVEALAGVSQRRRYISKRSTVQQSMPSPGGQISGMAGHQRGRDWVGWTGWGIPSISPQGYHTA
ncbi:MAG: hypothetical protein ACRDUW_11590, partial [Pseudonocardiaceae bacterium]